MWRGSHYRAGARWQVVRRVSGRPVAARSLPRSLGQSATTSTASADVPTRTGLSCVSRADDVAGTCAAITSSGRSSSRTAPARRAEERDGQHARVGLAACPSAASAP